MSTLTDEVKVVYVPLIYDIFDHVISEGPDCAREEDALIWAKESVRRHIDENYRYYYAEIKKRIVPVYK